MFEINPIRVGDYFGDLHQPVKRSHFETDLNAIWDKFPLLVFCIVSLYIVVGDTVSLILYAAKNIVSGSCIKKHLKIIEVLTHAKYSICKVFLEKSLTWAAPGHTSEKNIQ